MVGCVTCVAVRDATLAVTLVKHVRPVVLEAVATATHWPCIATITLARRLVHVRCAVRRVSVVFPQRSVVPVGFGYSPVVLLPLGLIVLYLIVQFLGRPVEEYAKSMAPLDDLPSVDASKADGTDTADGTNPEEKNAGEQSASDS